MHDSSVSMSTMTEKRRLILLVAFSAVLFAVNLNGYDLWPPDEPRFAQVAREMMQGHDYLVPRVNGLPYKEKPPLLFWAMAVFSAPFGDVTELTARLPSVFAGILTVVLAYLLASRLYGPRTAFWAGLILATTQRFWWQARFGQIDMLLTACVTAAFFCFWQWHTQRRNGYRVAFYLAIAAGVYAKGPPAAVFPLLMILTFYWRQRSERKALHLFAGLFAVAVLIAIWLIPARMAVSVESAANADGGISANLFRQTVGRFFMGVSHANPPWYYLLNAPLDLLPWSIFLPWTIPWVWKRRRESVEMRFLLSWIVPAFVFFSICSGKRAIYLLPLYPAFAILLARSVVDLMQGGRVRWRRWTGAAWGLLLVIFSAAPFALLFTEYRDSWNPSLAVFSLCAAACGIHALYGVICTDGRGLAQHVAAHFSILAAGIALVAFPAMNPHKSAKAFCAPLRHLSETGVDYDLYSLAFTREEYIYYAKHFHVPVLAQSLDVSGMPQISFGDQVKLVAGILRGMQKAVETVPVASIASVTDEEIQDFREAIHLRMAMAGLSQEIAAQYEAALTSYFDTLFRAMEGDTPVFIIVQESDWRWIVALHPSVRDYAIISEQSVGRRRVLLLANETAAQLVNPGNQTQEERL
jgi:4-amino-4-deoxy-L-arabinose transferase-like glycosyltransferase